MGVGQVFHDPPFRYVDHVSGREIRRLTDYLGHSHHPYFTDPCWFNGNRSLVFCSDRENRTNLFRYDLDSGIITQITDLDVRQLRLIGCVSEINNEVYFWQGTRLWAVDLETYARRTIAEVDPRVPPSPVKSRAAPTADGKYICAQLMEDLPQEQASISYAYSRFREYYEKRPLSRIVRIEIASGEQEIVHEDRRYLGHVNPSPTQPELLTFCHEGPWNLVEQRIWGLNIQTGETWKVRPQEGETLVGHEYWFADGIHIGYHGRPRDESGRHVFGHIRWDNEEWVEDHFPFHSTHFHSLDETIIVGDGTAAFRTPARPYIQLFKWNGTEYVGPKVLAYHRSTFNDQHAHCHPRFTPDGKAVLYTSDLTGYSNMYLVEIGEFDELPDLE